MKDVPRNRYLFASKSKVSFEPGLKCMAFSACFIFIILFQFRGLSIAEPAGESRESLIKAVMLFNFGKFIAWPDKPGDGSPSDFVVCFANAKKYQDVFSDFGDKKIQGKSIVIRTVGTSEKKAKCHIIFIGSSKRTEMEKILKPLRKKSVLTVGAAEGFLEAGGIINFVIIDNKIRFEVNVLAAKNVGLKVSSKLLRLAKIVEIREKEE